MGSKRIVCCNARNWTLFIGWTQAILNAILLGATVLILVVVIITDEHSDSGFYSAEEDEDSAELSDKYHNRTENETGTTDVDLEWLFHSDDNSSFLGEHIAFILLLVVTTLAFLWNFICGVVLILSVKQANARKLKTWLIIQLVFVVILIVMCPLTSIVSWEGGYLIAALVLINIFCIWVVNVHRKEVLSAGEGRVRYVSRI